MLRTFQMPFVYMHICSLIAYKMFLEKGSTAESSWENKGKNSTCRGLNSRLYNCMAIDRFGYTNYSQSACREYAQHVDSFLIRSWSLACRY